MFSFVEGLQILVGRVGLPPSPLSYHFPPGPQSCSIRMAVAQSILAILVFSSGLYNPLYRGDAHLHLRDCRTGAVRVEQSSSSSAGSVSLPLLSLSPGQPLSLLSQVVQKWTGVLQIHAKYGQEL